MLFRSDARVSTIVTLRCDRCLNHFNQAFEAEAHELLELVGSHASPAPSSGTGLPGGPIDPTELLPAADDLDDRLDPEGVFDPERWLFEQLSLRLPLVNRCGPGCEGPITWSSPETGGDPRWAALRRLQGG